jgi:aminoglycoside N3'-acetyltransferase
MSALVSARQLATGIGRIGVQDGGVVMVHASMRKLGPVDGGAETVLATLLESVGASGNLLMVLSADERDPFDARTSPVDTKDMGILAEVFRRHPRTEVNDHAADRFAAIGPLAKELLNPTPLHDYHGPGSVLERLVRANGTVLRLGANPDTVTLTHYAEYLADLPSKTRVKRKYVRADIGEQWIESLDDSDGIAVWAHGDYFPQIFLDFVKAGHARVGPVGNCTAELLPARAFVDFAVQWMETNLVGDAVRTRS